MSDFEDFWAAFPRRVGKLAAERAYATARKTATQEQLLMGIEAYKRNKPAYADWCHPRTWLMQGRWLDEAATTERPCPRCGTVPKCQSYLECNAKLFARKAQAS